MERTYAKEDLLCWYDTEVLSVFEDEELKEYMHKWFRIWLNCTTDEELQELYSDHICSGVSK